MSDIFCERIKQLRKELDMSLADLAEKLDIAPSSLSNYETGKRSPDAVVINKMVEHFKCSSDYLLGLSDFRTAVDENAYRQAEETLSDRFKELRDAEKSEIINSLNLFLENYALLEQLCVTNGIDLDFIKSLVSSISIKTEMLRTFRNAVEASQLDNDRTYSAVVLSLVSQKEQSISEINRLYNKMVSVIADRASFEKFLDSHFSIEQIADFQQPQAKKYENDV